MKRIQIQKYSDGRWGFDDYTSGQRRLVRCRSKEKAQARAMDIDVLMANGRVDLLQGTPAEWQEFRAWKAARQSSVSIAQAVQNFVQLKSKKSSRWLRSLTGDLKIFETFIGPIQPISVITALDIQRFLNSRDVGLRRQLNLRMSVISLFRWARRMSYLPDCTTEAEKVEPIEKVPGQPNVLTPDQMQTLLDNVQPQYLPWLVIGAFAGIRSEEIAPDYDTKKSPLAWTDFDWQHEAIIIRAETAKTKEEREVPILPNLAQWLAPWHNAKGSVIGDVEQPSRRETGRLGTFIGGWKHNCLRDSFCSYRAAMTQNVPQVSYEMGNSIYMVKKSYHKRQPIRAAQEWFNIRPVQDAKMITLPMERSA